MNPSHRMHRSREEKMWISLCSLTQVMQMTRRRDDLGLVTSCMINLAPIAWLSKKQATVETSVFGAEFVAMKLGVEHSRSLRYKLRMMGVPINGPTNVYGDNMSVIHNTQRPESTSQEEESLYLLPFHS